MSSIHTTVSLAADAFIKDFDKRNPSLWTEAVTYLSVVAIEGNDKKFNELMPQSSAHLTSLRERAHDLKIIPVDGPIHAELQTALRAYLEHEGLYMMKFADVRDEIAQLDRPTSPRRTFP